MNYLINKIDDDDDNRSKIYPKKKEEGSGKVKNGIKIAILKKKISK